MFTLGHQQPLQYGMMLQEDRYVEWLTVGLFVAAGIAHLRRALPRRHVFDVLVAVFCLFVAGEEFSWGQRLFGFTPPGIFLEHNVQQEFTLHNFRDTFGKPKSILTMALVGYAIVLPFLARLRFSATLTQSVGATPPPLALVPWFLAAIVLLVWYPLDLTGEWVEALAAALFFTSATPSPRGLATGFISAAAAAAVLTVWSGRGKMAHPQTIACAEKETRALVEDVANGTAASSDLLDPEQSIHKRLYSAVIDGYIRSDALSRYRQVRCGASQSYFLDVWGMPFWIRVDRTGEGPREIQVYSMGPNRRRDSSESQTRGDDIVANGFMHP